MANDRNPIHIAIVGSWDYPLLDHVDALVARLPASCVIVTGDARGVDATVRLASLRRKLPVLIVPTEDGGLGDDKELIRNAKIIDRADRLVLYWDGKDGNLANLVLQASRRKLPVEIYGPDGAPVPVERVLRTASGKSRSISA